MGVSRVLSTSKRGLFLTAAGLWIFSGVKVLLIGVHAWKTSHTSSAHYIWLAVAIIFFSGIVFPPVARKNIAFVHQLYDGRHPLWRCFKPSSWLIMAIMMTFGIWLRLSGYASESFVSGFYCGLGGSLFAVSLYYTKTLKRSI